MAAYQLGVSIRTVKAWEADERAIPYPVRLAVKALDTEMEVPL